MAQEIKNKVDNNVDLSNLSEKEKQDLLLSLRRLGGKNGQQKRPAPTTDDELWDWIVAETGYEIPRVSVCEDHCAPFDYVADYYFERESAILVIGGRESAKCISEDSLIYNVETGIRTKVKDFMNEDINKISSMDKDGNIIISDIDDKWYTGEKECLRFTTVSGKQIDVTPEHPFMTQDGWRRADQIEVGEAVATPAFIPFQTNQVEIPDSDLVLLAGLLSEGSISQAQTGFSTSDEHFLNLMTKASEEKSCSVKHRCNYDYSIIRNIGTEKRNSVSKMLGKYGVDYVLAKNKYIPDVIFSLNKTQLSKFISIFWMADGCIEENSVTMCLASEQLIKDFQHLLLKFGIQSRYKFRVAKFQGKEFNSWKLEVYGNHVKKFYNSFDLWGYKKDRLKIIVEKNRCPSAGRPPLTSSMLSYFKSKTPQRKYGTGIRRTKEAYELLGWKPEKSFGVRVLTRGKVKNLQSRRLRALCHAHELDESEFSILLNNDLWWDFVTDIENVGIKKVYDLTVSSTESFVANDIIVHNTLNTAIANYAIAENNPGCEICTFADIEQQSNKSYSYIKSFVYSVDESGKKVAKSTVEGVPLRKETLLKNGSKLEVIIGTLSGVNSPHPQKVHADEVDLQEKEIWREAQPLDTEIPTPNGWTTMGEISEGDYVFGLDGIPTKVVKVNDLGYRDVYKIEFTDGRATECAGDHLWLLGTKSGNDKVWRLYRTSNLVSDYKKKDARGIGYKYKYSLPKNESVQYFDYLNKLPLHPYILGVLLGDGCLRNRKVNFRAKDRNIVNKVKELLPDGVHVHESVCGESTFHITKGLGGGSAINPIVDIMETLGLKGTNSHTKFIPSIYLKSSEDDRISLVRGLMDTDGSFTKDAYFSTVSKRLAEGMQELIYSLGGRGLLRKKKTSSSSFKNCGYIYEVSASLPDEICPFYTPIKATKFKVRKRGLNSSIKNIEKIEDKIVRCINVENEDGIYLTENFIPTHNSRNMSSSKTFSDGRTIKAQDIATSTLKSTKGIVQEIVDETKKSIKAGLKPTWKIYIACVFEVAKEVPSCRQAPREKREARLIELGKDPCELCECNRVAKGEISDGVPRKLESVCGGKFFKSRGWMSYEDVVRKFVQNIPSKWASQLECRRPLADGLYLPTWSREKFCIRNYEPRSEYGYIWQGIDWGGQESNAILWIQGPLHQPLQVNNTLGTKTIIPQGSYVIFKEINEAAVGATRLADMVVRQEIQYRNRYGGAWKVKARFADMAGRQQREDWREHKPPLLTKWYLTGSKEGSRAFDPTVECLQGLVIDSLLYVDDQTCPGTCDDFESWRSKDGREIHDESSHNPAAARYCLKNVTTWIKKNSNNISKVNLQPIVVARSAADNVPGAVAQVGVPSSSDYSSEAWRQTLGAPAGPGDFSSMGRGRDEPWRP